MRLFSKELEELDKNTVQYMIDELQEEVDAQKEQLDVQKKELEAKDKLIAQLQEQLRKKNDVYVGVEGAVELIALLFVLSLK